jgi:acetyl esterase/lipase
VFSPIRVRGHEIGARVVRGCYKSSGRERRQAPVLDHFVIQRRRQCAGSTPNRIAPDVGRAGGASRFRHRALVLHGANDTNVPVIEAEQVVENLRRRNVPVEYILFPDEGHGWRKTPNRVRSTVAIVE